MNGAHFKCIRCLFCEIFILTLAVLYAKHNNTQNAF